MTMDPSQCHILPRERNDLLSPQMLPSLGHLAKIVENMRGIYHSTIPTPLTFMSPFSKTESFLFSFLDCLGACLCCDNQG